MIFLAVIYLLGLAFIAVYSLSQLQLVYFFLKYRHRPPKKLGKLPEIPPKVLLQLPIYNEMYVVERLLEAVFSLDYPPDRLLLQILDDSTDQTQQIISQQLQKLSVLYPQIRWQYLHREDRAGFKAGALSEGLRQAGADYELVGIFDADFVPKTDFLTQTLPYFYDENGNLSASICTVQARWGHLNKHENLLTELQAMMLDAHFSIEHIGRNRAGLFMNFNGTAGVWRRAAIEDAGGWHSDTLTEDLDLSYRAQLRGWGFVYDEAIVCPAELPSVVQAVKSQQFRWVKGAAEVARKSIKTLLFAPNIGFLRRWQGAMHLLNSGVFVSVLIVSILSVPVNYGFYTQQIPAVFGQIGHYLGFVLYVVMSFFASSFFYREGFSLGKLLTFIGRFPLLLAASYGLGLHNAWAALQGYFGYKTEFVRTPKLNGIDPNQAGLYLHKKVKFNWLRLGEWLLFSYFFAACGLDICWETFRILPFHLLLATGYLLLLRSK